MPKEYFKRFFMRNPLKNPYIVINGVGYREEMSPGLVRRPKGLGDYLFMYFYGPVSVGSMKKHPKYDGGILIIWPPGSDHYYGNREHGYLHTWTHCEGVWIRKLLDSAGFPLDKPVELADPALFEDFILEIYREALRRDSDPVIARNMFENLVRELKRRLSKESQPAPRPEWLETVREYMDREYRSRLGLEDLAAIGHKSVPHFCSEFKKHYRCAPIEYIIRHRLNESLHLLHDINLSVTEIAERVGYEDIYHFSKIFKKQYGVSPMGMRKRFR